jgi:hypothetical protein
MAFVDVKGKGMYLKCFCPLGTFCAIELKEIPFQLLISFETFFSKASPSSHILSAPLPQALS